MKTNETKENQMFSPGTEVLWSESANPNATYTVGSDREGLDPDEISLVDNFDGSELWIAKYDELRAS